MSGTYRLESMELDDGDDGDDVSCCHCGCFYEGDKCCHCHCVIENDDDEDDGGQ